MARRGRAPSGAGGRGREGASRLLACQHFSAPPPSRSQPFGLIGSSDAAATSIGRPPPAPTVS
ncbi:unnamed protein product [Amoebophrya sp. A120]|nr:unnamed protein product [Amoebophrya sp. A120]|eukprot:GSA120T00022416001.1